jgi:hypothetical protein
MTSVDSMTNFKIKLRLEKSVNGGTTIVVSGYEKHKCSIKAFRSPLLVAFSPPMCGRINPGILEQTICSHVNESDFSDIVNVLKMTISRSMESFSSEPEESMELQLNIDIELSENEIRQIHLVMTITNRQTYVIAKVEIEDEDRRRRPIGLKTIRQYGKIDQNNILFIFRVFPLSIDDDHSWKIISFGAWNYKESDE